MTQEGQPSSPQVEAPPRTEVLGTPIHIVDIEDVLRLMEQWIAARGRPHWIAVTGSHGVLEAYKKPDFRAVLETADLSVPDGRWAARFAAGKMSCPTHQVRGADLLSAFCALSAQKGYTNYFYGDTQQTLSAAARRLAEICGPDTIVGLHAPPFRDLTAAEDAQVVEMITKPIPMCFGSHSAFPSRSAGS